MIARSKLLYFLMFMAVTVVLNGCGGGGSSPAPKGQSGRLTQGPIDKAEVFADNIDKGVRFVRDADEIWTTTDEKGDFTLPSVPGYNYVLASKGGIDTITKQEAIQMIAPADSANITTLTTLVALDTTGLVKAKLEAMMPTGVKYDTDISTTTSPAALMVAKSVETVVQTMTNAVTDKAAENTNTVSPAQLIAIQAQTMQAITQEFAKPAVTATTLSTPKNLTTSLQTATTASVASINSSGNITIPAETAKAIATSAVTATTTALNISTTETASKIAMTGGETKALETTAVKLVADVKTATAVAVLSTKAVTTLATYTPPPIQVAAPPAALYIPPALGSQTIGNISFKSSTNEATLNIGGTITASAVASSGLPVTFKSESPAVCTVSGSTVTGVTDGMCLVSASQPGNSGYTPAKQVESFITIRAKQTIGSIVFSPTELIVDGTTTVSAAATSGLPVTFNSTTPDVCTVSGKTITAISAGTCFIAADQIGTTNYISAPQQTTNIAVSKKSQAITITTMPPQGALADSYFSVAATAPGGPVTYSSATPTICTVAKDHYSLRPGDSFDMLTGGTCIVQYNQAGNSVYSAAPQTTATSSVSKQDSSVVFDMTTIPETLSIDETATPSYYFFAFFDNTIDWLSDTPSVCSYSAGSVTAISAGTCNFHISLANGARYNPSTSAIKSIKISKKKQEITVVDSAPATAIVGIPFTVSAVATSGTVNYSSSGSCSNTGNIFTLNTSGTCTIMFDSPATSLYSAAPQVTNTTVSKRLSQTIGTITYVSTGSSTITLSATSDSGLPVVFTNTTPGSCSVNGTTVTATSAATCTVAANQAGNATYSPANTRFIDIIPKVIPPTFTGGSSTFVF